MINRDHGWSDHVDTIWRASMFFYIFSHHRKDLCVFIYFFCRLGRKQLSGSSKRLICGPNSEQFRLIKSFGSYFLPNFFGGIFNWLTKTTDDRIMWIRTYWVCFFIYFLAAAKIYVYLYTFCRLGRKQLGRRRKPQKVAGIVCGSITAGSLYCLHLCQILVHSKFIISRTSFEQRQH